MEKMKKLILVALIASSASLLGCRSVPMTSDTLDAYAKKFQPEPSCANIYITRKKSMVGAATLVQTAMDGRIIGSLASGTFQMISVAPGEHILTTTGQSYNENPIKIQAEAGKSYFYRVSVSMRRVVAGEFYLKPVDEKEGQKHVTALKRAEIQLTNLTQIGQ